MTEAINSTNRIKTKETELKGPRKDCKINVISLKKPVKLLNLHKRHIGDLDILFK